MEDQSIRFIPQPPVTKIILIILSVFIASALYFKFVGPIPLSITSINSFKSDLFSVTGEGKIAAIPDIVKIDLGITVNKLSIKTAQNEVNTVIKKIQDDLKIIGIPEKDIQTTNYNVNPTYDWTTGKGRITGYDVSSNLQVRVTNFELINDVIDRATADGANLVSDLQFSVDDNKLKELRDKARSEAIKQAKEKAQKLASEAGLKLGKVVNVEENVSNPGNTAVYNFALKEAATDRAQTQIQPGEQEIKISITLSYETL